MPEVLILNLRKYKFKIINLNKTILESIHNEYIDWMHACGGKSRCTSCKMQVLEGEEFLSPISTFESECRKNGKLKQNERLTCVSKFNNSHGKLCISVPKDTQLKHIDYSE